MSGAMLLFQQMYRTFKVLRESCSEESFGSLAFPGSFFRSGHVQVALSFLGVFFNEIVVAQIIVLERVGFGDAMRGE